MNATHTTCSFGHFAMVSLVFLPLAPRDAAAFWLALQLPALCQPAYWNRLNNFFCNYLLKLWRAFIAQVGVLL
jgi:hypothetical protein